MEKGEKRQIRYHVSFKTSIENNETSKLTKKELEELDRNIHRLLGMTASQVSAYSHEDMPVKSTKKGEIIDYDLVHYRNPVFSISIPKWFDHEWLYYSRFCTRNKKGSKEGLS